MPDQPHVGDSRRLMNAAGERNAQSWERIHRGDASAHTSVARLLDAEQRIHESAAPCLSCPSCASQDVTDTAKSDAGAYCRCHSCGNMWHDDSAKP